METSRTRSPLPAAPWYLGCPCGLAALAMLLIIVVCAPSLQLGSLIARITVGISLLVFTLLITCLLRGCGSPTSTTLLLLLPIAVALYLRLLCLDHQTHDYQTFLAEWAAFFRNNGGFAALKKSIGDYNVTYLYFLAAISYLPIPDLYLIKLLSVLFDLLLAFAGLRLSQNLCGKNSPAPLICFVILLFLPTVTLNGAYWAQCDSLYTALLLLAFSSVLEQRPKSSVVFLALAFSFKLQTVFLIPLWCVFWYTRRIKFRHLLLFPVIYGLTILPALALGKPLSDILSIYLGQMNEYGDFLTMNAPSVFAFLPYGVQIDPTPFSRTGIIAAFGLVLFLLILLFCTRKRVSPQILLAAAAVMSIGVPFLLPNMHERYFFLADVITLVLACTNRKCIPIAVLTQLSSLSSYSTYLHLQYTLPLYVNGQFYVMAFEALLMLTALVWSLAVLFRQIK